MPPDDLHYRFYIADIPYEVVTGKFHPPVPSLVDFYNETGHSSMLVERPVRPSIFLLFRDLAVDRRLMSTCTSFFFVLAASVPTAAHRSFVHQTTISPAN